jgi:hypothetical protein
MTYSVTLLASLLASAHGFATMRSTGGVKCSANEEKFFVYSIDPSSTRSLPRLGGLISLPT